MQNVIRTLRRSTKQFYLREKRNKLSLPLLLFLNFFWKCWPMQFFKINVLGINVDKRENSIINRQSSEFFLKEMYIKEKTLLPIRTHMCIHMYIYILKSSVVMQMVSEQMGIYIKKFVYVQKVRYYKSIIIYLYVTFTVLHRDKKENTTKPPETTFMWENYNMMLNYAKQILNKRVCSSLGRFNNKRTSVVNYPYID